MVDVKLALEDLKEESDSGKLPRCRAAAPAPRQSVGDRDAGVAVLAATSVAFWWLRPPAPFGAPVLMQLTTDAGLTTDPALSPDGKMLAYASDRAGTGNLDIWVRQVGGGEPLQLTEDPANEREPAFSLTGPRSCSVRRKTAAASTPCRRWEADSAPEDRAAPGGNRPRFSPDGSQIAYWTGSFRRIGCVVRRPRLLSDLRGPDDRRRAQASAGRFHGRDVSRMGA